MIKDSKKLINKRLRFVFYFMVFYFVFLFFGLSFIGPFLINIQYKLIELLFKENISSQLVFVSHCSGVVSLATYLAIVASFSFLKIKTSFKKIIFSCVVLLFYNVLRLLLIVYLATISLFYAEVAHVVSWFIVFIIIILLIKDYKIKI
jgi:exosortase/archaeosortase family protein